MESSGAHRYTSTNESLAEPIVMVQPHDSSISRLRSRDVIKLISIIAACLITLYLVILLIKLLTTLVIAAFLAVACDPGVRFLERRGMPRRRAVLVFSLGVLLALAGLLSLFIPPLV